MVGSTRVCHVVNSVGPTSIPADIAVALTERQDIESGILAWFDAEPFTGDETVDVYCLDAERGLFDVDACRRARDVIRGYDVVHTHHCHSGTFVKPIAALSNSVLVSTEHNAHRGYTRKGRLSNGLLNPLSDRVTCVSRAVYDSFERWEKSLLSDDQVDVIPNGVVTDRVTQAASGSWPVPSELQNADILVYNAAMLTEQKGQDTLIEAVANVNGVVESTVELAITGTGPLRDELASHAARFGIRDGVHFLGLLDRREQVYRLMHAADVFAMPSRWEGFCVAVAEAMAAGTPCVLSDISVFRELYEGPALFHAVDDSDALSDRLESLIHDEDARRRIGAQSEEHVRTQYEMRETADRYAALFADLLNDS